MGTVTQHTAEATQTEQLAQQAQAYRALRDDAARAQQLVTANLRAQRIAAFNAFQAAAARQDQLYQAYQALDVRDYDARDTARWTYLQACDTTLAALAEYDHVKALCYGAESAAKVAR